ncbi:MAG: TIGR03751 family conjugal transfer lipoprotein [Steroidobacteraceae bacterium]
MKQNHRSLCLIVAGCLGLTACANKQVLPDSGPDIQEVYERHIGGMKGAPARPPTDEEIEAQQKDAETGPRSAVGPAVYRPVRDGQADLVDYTRHAGNELDQLFPVLPNPQIVMYVFPHFTAKGRPVPGYSTAFKMYEKEEYAMPGEWIPDHPDALPGRGFVQDDKLTASHAWEDR